MRTPTRIALIGEASGAQILERLLACSPPTRRLQLSFTTGLKPSLQRRFRIHLLPLVNTRIHSQLAAQGIRFVAASV